MQLIKKKERIGNILFIIAIAIELTIMMTDHMASFTLPLRGRWAQLAFVLFGCKILTTRYSLRQWCVIVLIGILGVISYFTMGDEYALRAAVMVFAGKDVDRDVIKKMCFAFAMAGTAIIVLLALTGVAGSMYDMRDYNRGAIETRWCLGFNHANNVHCIYWYIVTAYIYMRDNKCKLYEYIIMLAANAGLYLLTASKTGLFASMLVIAVAIVAKYYEKIKGFMLAYILGALTIVACVVLTIIGSTYSCFESKFCAYLDKFLNQRLNMCHDHANISGWKLFPGPVTFEKYVDNGIAAWAYSEGIVLLLVMLTLIFWLVWKSYKEKNIVLLVMIVTCTYVWFMEASFIINTSLCCCLFYIFAINRWYLNESV